MRKCIKKKQSIEMSMLLIEAIVALIVIILFCIFWFREDRDDEKVNDDKNE